MGRREQFETARFGGFITCPTGRKKPALVFHHAFQQIESSQRYRACRVFPKSCHVRVVARESFTDGLFDRAIMLRVQDRRFFPKTSAPPPMLLPQLENHQSL